MDPITGTVIGGLGSILGGVFGSIFGSGEAEKARQAAENAFKIISSTGAPPDMARAIILDQFKSAGVLHPQLEQVINQQFSEVAGMQEAANARSPQVQALAQIAERARGGLGAEDIAAMNQARDAANAANQGRLGSIQQSYAARGLGGGGAELAASLASAQQAANQQSNEGANIAALASQRGLQAVQGLASMGGALRAQDYQQNLAKAEAQDKLNQFNTMNSVQTQRANIDRMNQAQQFNLAQQQALSNMNTAQANAERQRQMQGLQQNYMNQLNLNQTKANALLGESGYHQGQAKATADQWTGIGGGIAGIAGSLASKGNWNKLLEKMGQAGTASKPKAAPSKSKANPFDDEYNYIEGY